MTILKTGMALIACVGATALAAGDAFGDMPSARPAGLAAKSCARESSAPNGSWIEQKVNASGGAGSDNFSIRSRFRATRR
ncbi:MAG: hypothetical protein WBV61_00380 [Rhodanobacteraceae bacterium]